MAPKLNDSFHLGLPDRAPSNLQAIPEDDRAGSMDLLSRASTYNNSNTPASRFPSASSFRTADTTRYSPPPPAALPLEGLPPRSLPPVRMEVDETMHSIPDSVRSVASSQVPHPLRPSKGKGKVRALQNSLSAISLTPSDTIYPMGLLRSATNEDLSKAKRLLGLQNPSSAAERAEQITALPSMKDASTSTTAVLPTYSFEAPGTHTKGEPLNGRTAWLHALTGALVVFNCWGLANAFGLFQAYYERDYLGLQTNPSSISWIGSTQLALVFGLGVPVGKLVDMGYFRLVFHTGSVVMILGIFCTAWCTTLWSLWLVQGLVTGLGMGMVFCSGVVALMTWFDERKLGAAMGLSAAGSCIGGIVYIIIARKLLVSHGFAFTMRVLGGVAAVALIPPNLIFRVRGQRHRGRSRQHSGSRGLGLKTFTAPAYLLAAGGMFFAFLGVYFGFVYIVSFASTQLRLSDTGATNLLIYMLTANLPGRFVPALISDRCIGPLNTIIPSIFLSAACVGLWMSIGDGVDKRSALTVVACFYGFVSAGVQVLYAPTVYAFCLEPAPISPKHLASTVTRSISDRESVQLATDRMGVKAGGIFTCIGLACLVGTPIGGALIRYRSLHAETQPYLAAQVFAMGCLLAGGGLLLASRVVRVGCAAKRA